MPSPAPSPSDIITRLRAAGCVFAEDEARLLISAARTPADLSAMVNRRTAGLPLEYVLGWAQFGGLRIAVEPGVFVPRRRTEFLLREAAAIAGIAARPRPVIVDLCCGSGAVGAALLAAVHGIDLHAADIDPTAVRCARRNIGADGHVYKGDLYEAIPVSLKGRIDILVANAPYVPTDEIALMPPEARLYEAQVALDGGTDGLDVVRRVIAAAPDWLAPGGTLLVETSDRQAPQAVSTLERSGLVARVARSEELNATVAIATMPGTVTIVRAREPST